MLASITAIVMLAAQNAPTSFFQDFGPNTTFSVGEYSTTAVKALGFVALADIAIQVLGVALGKGDKSGWDIAKPALGGFGIILAGYMINWYWDPVVKKGLWADLPPDVSWQVAAFLATMLTLAAVAAVAYGTGRGTLGRVALGLTVIYGYLLYESGFLVADFNGAIFS